MFRFLTLTGYYTSEAGATQELHFEMIPDRLPDALRDPIRRFPAGALQFEVGIQTFNEEVAARISRRQDARRVEDNLRFLRDETGMPANRWGNIAMARLMYF